MNCPFCIKVCTKCGKLLVAYSGNFYKKKSGKCGFRPQCKECMNKKRAEHYKNNKEKIAEQQAEYYKNNKEKIAEQKAKYYKNNKEKIAEINAEYRKNNKEKIAEINAEYYKNNPHIFLNKNNKRRQLEENQGNGITKEQWLEMNRFFNWECAYSGESLSNKNIRTVDHIMPLSEGGLNEIWNCVPMYRPYNTSKHTNDMLDWYKKQPYFSEERLQKIYEWIEYAYEKWGKEE